MMPPSRLWSELSADDFRSSNIGHWIAIFPLAAIEQHGPHLPLGTDAMIGEAYLARVHARLPGDLPAVFLPQQEVGKSDEHQSFPGTLTLSGQTMIKVLVDIGDSLHRAGIRKMVMVSAHGGNMASMEIVARDLRLRHKMLAVYTSWDRLGFPDGVYTPEELSFGIHAGDVETSLMRAIRPDLAHMTRAENFSSRGKELAERFKHLRTGRPAGFGWLAEDLNSRGAMGNAAAAEAEKGHASLDFGAGRFIELLREVQTFELAPGSGAAI